MPGYLFCDLCVCKIHICLYFIYCIQWLRVYFVRNVQFLCVLSHLHHPKTVKYENTIQNDPLFNFPLLSFTHLKGSGRCDIHISAYRDLDFGENTHISKAVRMSQRKPTDLRGRIFCPGNATI